MREYLMVMLENGFNMELPVQVCMLVSVGLFCEFS